MLIEIGFFGKDVGDSVQLSFIESCYLFEKGILKVHKKMVRS